MEDEFDAWLGRARYERRPALAIYAALAMALEDIRERTVLPLGRRDAIDAEAGVREPAPRQSSGLRSSR